MAESGTEVKSKIKIEGIKNTETWKAGRRPLGRQQKGNRKQWMWYRDRSLRQAKLDHNSEIVVPLNVSTATAAEIAGALALGFCFPSFFFLRVVVSFFACVRAPRLSLA